MGDFQFLSVSQITHVFCNTNPFFPDLRTASKIPLLFFKNLL